MSDCCQVYNELMTDLEIDFHVWRLRCEDEGFDSMLDILNYEPSPEFLKWFDTHDLSMKSKRKRRVDTKRRRRTNNPLGRKPEAIIFLIKCLDLKVGGYWIDENKASFKITSFPELDRAYVEYKGIKNTPYAFRKRFLEKIKWGKIGKNAEPRSYYFI